MNGEPLVFLSRRNCHLCEEAHARVIRVASELHLAVSEFDVDEDQGLLADFGDRVPVVLYRDQVIAEGRIDDQHLRQGLERYLPS
jgi:ABC-type uncharacterized transport system ATPase subunit